MIIQSLYAISAWELIFNDPQPKVLHVDNTVEWLFWHVHSLIFS